MEVYSYCSETLRKYHRKLLLCVVIFLILLVNELIVFYDYTNFPSQVLPSPISNYKENKSNINLRININETIQKFNNSTFKFHLCNCIRRLGKVGQFRLLDLPQSTCSDFATQRGTGQRVISYSYYSDKNNTKKGSFHALRYLEALRDRVKDAKSIYPNWTVRVYTDVKHTNKYATEVLCDVYCNDVNVDLCDVFNLPIIGNAYGKYNGMFWRFLPMGDPTVDLFLSRDLDSVIQRREFDAVSEWLSSNKTFHVMRDHPSHFPIILGGLWGAKNYDKVKLKFLRDKLFNSTDKHKYGYDQEILKKFLWPAVKDDILQHDSFLCRQHKGSKPFPTKRNINVYVGWGPYGKAGPLSLFLGKNCPLKCRKDPSWKRC